MFEGPPGTFYNSPVKLKEGSKWRKWGQACNILLALVACGAPFGWLDGAACVLALAAVASYCAMNFTGSSTFTSPSGVEREMRRALPLQLGALAVAAVCWLAAAFQGGAG